MTRSGHIVSRTVLGVRRDPSEWHLRCRKLHQYWRALPRDGYLPARSVFEPADLPDLLPDLFLIDVVWLDDERRRYRYRLVGTQNVERFGRDNTGLWLDEAIDEQHRAGFLKIYERAVLTRQPVCEQLTAEHMERDYLYYERLLLPLASDGNRPDMLVGFICETGG